MAAVSYQVEPVGGPARVALQSELVANQQLPPSGGDPRAAAVLEAPLRPEEHRLMMGRAALVHKTGRSGLRVAVAVHHLVDGPAGTGQVTETTPDVARRTVIAWLEPGQHLHLVKFVAFGWSGTRSRPALRDQVEGALAAAMQAGWGGLAAGQRGYLDAFWGRSDVEVDGDAEIQQAVRFGLFHVLQAGARAEDRAIAAKGLTGTGYDGHAFWDTEIFVLPVLTWTTPQAVAHALRWRQATLPMAAQRARQLRLNGAAFPWRTINGAESSGYWPAGTAAFHINADIAHAVIGYLDATGDQEFDRGTGLDLLTATARLWRSLGHHDAAGRFRIDGVTGPDEYSAIADNNVYTNLMAHAAEPGRRRRGGAAAPRPGRGTWRIAGRGRRLAGGRRGDAAALRPGAGGTPAGRRVHRAPAVGLRGDRRGSVPAAAAFPVLRAVPQAGGQAG